jgi:hypothetical protein
MKKVCNYCVVTSVSDDFLRDSNKELGLERAQLRFQFLAGAGKGAAALASAVDTSNSGTKLVDVSTQIGDNVPEKCKSLLNQFKTLANTSKEDIASDLGVSVDTLTDDDVKSYRYPRFTVFTFQISELGIIRDGENVTIVNNGQRNYPQTSVTYLEKFDDIESARQTAKAQIEKRLDNGDYEIGSLDDDDADDDNADDNTDTKTNRNDNRNGNRNNRRR